MIEYCVATGRDRDAGVVAGRWYGSRFLRRGLRAEQSASVLYGQDRGAVVVSSAAVTPPASSSPPPRSIPPTWVVWTAGVGSGWNGCGGGNVT